MEAGHVTPRAVPPDRDIAWYEQQHEHDLEALDRAADLAAAQSAQIADLRREQQILILQARRERLA